MGVLFLHEMQSSGYFSPEIQNVTMVSDDATSFRTHQQQNQQKQVIGLFNISENLQNDRFRIGDN